MWKKRKWKDAFIIFLILILFGIIFYDFAIMKSRHNKQVVVARLVTEEASKSKDILYDNLRVSLKDALIPGDMYRLTIDFQVVDKRGKRFLISPVKQTDDQANLGCVKLEYSERFVASKERMQVYLQMAITGTEITDAHGNVIDFRKQKLAPIIMVEKETNR